MKKSIFIAAIFIMSLCSCKDVEGESRRVLKSAGYTNITLTGYDPFSCSDEDVFSTGFTATGPTGEHVKGVVCSGLMKGATIRIL